jgi:hypothetical protein
MNIKNPRFWNSALKMRRGRFYENFITKRESLKFVLRTCMLNQGTGY